jgi:hypothetical protein
VDAAATPPVVGVNREKHSATGRHPSPRLPGQRESACGGPLPSPGAGPPGGRARYYCSPRDATCQAAGRLGVPYQYHGRVRTRVRRKRTNTSRSSRWQQPAGPERAARTPLSCPRGSAPPGRPPARVVFRIRGCRRRARALARATLSARARGNRRNPSLSAGYVTRDRERLRDGVPRAAVCGVARRGAGAMLPPLPVPVEGSAPMCGGRGSRLFCVGAGNNCVGWLAGCWLRVYVRVVPVDWLVGLTRKCGASIERQICRIRGRTGKSGRIAHAFR